MAQRVLRGVAASPGVAVGVARSVAPVAVRAESTVDPGPQRRREALSAVAALDRAVSQVMEVAARLRGQGREDEAEIVETGALMASDPQLRAVVETACLERGTPAAAAIIEATAKAAERIADLDDAALAARAADVRSVGQRAARLTEDDADAAVGEELNGQGRDTILIGTELGPADVAELGANVAAIALAASAKTAHAAIVARSLGVPMVVCLGEGILAVADGESLVLDGDQGNAILAPSADRVLLARRSARSRRALRQRVVAASGLPATTADGHRVRVLANVSAPTEVATAMGAGADGVGLLRTELAFLEATRWPTEEEHRRALQPILKSLEDLPATVRVLDFGGDKTPPFLSGAPERGTGLLLRHPEALEAQLRAILAEGAGTDLRLLLPMVADPREVGAVRDVLRRVARRQSMPPVGAMIETPEAVANVAAIATEADFLSIGTNDLTHATLEADRFGPEEAFTHHPQVLRGISQVVDAGRHSGDLVEICGEAASDPMTMPLLLGLGAGEISVGAARVGVVRAWVRRLSFRRVEALARAAVATASAIEVAAMVRGLAADLESFESGDAEGEGLDGGTRIGSVGP